MLATFFERMNLKDIARGEEEEHFGFVVNGRSYWRAEDAWQLSSYPWIPAPSCEPPTNSINWSACPQEVRDLILEHAFSVPLTDSLRYISLMKLASPRMASAFWNTSPSPITLATNTVLLGLGAQSMRLFVSKKFLRDALPHFVRYTAISLEGCSLDDIAKILPAEPRNLFHFLLSRLLSGTPELRIIPRIDGAIRAITRDPASSISYFRNLQCVKISLPTVPPTWVVLPTSLWHNLGDLIPEDQVTESDTRIQMRKCDVLKLTKKLEWPLCRKRRFMEYLRSQSTYESAKSLAGELVASGYQGSVVLFAGFRCEQSNESDNGWGKRHGAEGEYFISLHLQFDLCNDDRLMEASSVATYRNAANGTWIDYE